MPSDKKKKRKFSRAQIENIKASGGKAELQRLLSDLMQRALDGSRMSQAEKEHAYRILRASSTDSRQQLDIDDFPSLEEYHFKELYRSYHGDLEGKYGIEDAWGLVKSSQKIVDVGKLNKVFSEWQIIVKKDNHKEYLLKRVCAEARAELKQLMEVFKNSTIPVDEFPAKEKSIILHARYLYLTVKEFFDENDGIVTARYNNSEIEIDEYSFSHIMFRHYAGLVKQFDTKKSFNFDSSIDYKSLPIELKKILEAISGSGLLSTESPSFIPFRHNGAIYAIWTAEAEKSIKGKRIKFTQLRTYYPIQEKAELLNVENLRDEIFISPNLSVFRLKNA